MTPLEMIAEWRRGCSCAPKERPEECYECTRALIDALERALNGERIVAIGTFTRSSTDGEVLEHRAIPIVDNGVDM